jgi:restriction system protein
MTTIWGLHNDRPELGLLDKNFVSVGWDEVGDLTRYPDRDALKAALAAAFPTAKPGAIPIWAGVLYRFAYELQIDDLVIYPHRPDSTLSIGCISGEYRYEPTAGFHRNRRNVSWLKTRVPRAEFSSAALYEIGSAVTLFRVRNHAAEFESYLAGSTAVESGAERTPVPVEDAVAQAEDEPNADRVEQHSRDFVINTLLRMDPLRFERLVEHLLNAMGYRTQLTEEGGDGGIDIVAHRDPLGLEPPIIKVQCKRTATSIPGSDVQRLIGTLAGYSRELGLFVTLGNYSREAIRVSRNREGVRLIDGPELVKLIFENYEGFAPEWQSALPLRRLYVVDLHPGT